MYKVGTWKIGTRRKQAKLSNIHTISISFCFPRTREQQRATLFILFLNSNWRWDRIVTALKHPADTWTTCLKWAYPEVPSGWGKKFPAFALQVLFLDHWYFKIRFSRRVFFKKQTEFTEQDQNVKCWMTVGEGKDFGTAFSARQPSPDSWPGSSFGSCPQTPPRWLSAPLPAQSCWAIKLWVVKLILLFQAEVLWFSHQWNNPPDTRTPRAALELKA